MANEITASAINDIVNQAAIEPVFLDYAHPWVVAQQFFRRFTLRDGQGAALQVPRLDSNLGTVGANGAGFDAEFDASEATDLSSNIAITTSSVTLTPAEYGFKHVLTDAAANDNILGAVEWISQLIANAARILTTALEYDCLALFSGLGNSVGVSGSDLTVAQALASLDNIRARGHRAPDPRVMVLDDEQWINLRDAQVASSTSVLTYAAAGDRLVGLNPSADRGALGGHVADFAGAAVWVTGEAPTQNTAADVLGAAFTPSSPGNDPHATFGIVERKVFSVETQRDASARATEIVFSMRMGVGELSDTSGTAIITDAP